MRLLKPYSLFVALVLVIAVIGCHSEPDTTGPTITTELVPGEATLDMGPPSENASVTGGGFYVLAGFLKIQFSLSAVMGAGGNVSGQFHQRLTFEGHLIEFHGEVTCFSVDESNGRAWIGGIVTKNKSEHPDFVGGIYEPGRDVWFRVLDDGNEDRTTFLGFEGGGGIITSEEYCEGMIWPDDNARTNPVTHGQILINP